MSPLNCQIQIESDSKWIFFVPPRAIVLFVFKMAARESLSNCIMHVFIPIYFWTLQSKCFTSCTEVLRFFIEAPNLKSRTTEFSALKSSAFLFLFDDRMGSTVINSGKNFFEIKSTICTWNACTWHCLEGGELKLKVATVNSGSIFDALINKKTGIVENAMKKRRTSSIRIVF